MHKQTHQNSLNKITKVFKLGIRQKVILVLIIILAISLSLTGWYSLQQQEQSIVEQTRQRGEDLVRLTNQSLVYKVIGYDYHAIQLLLEEVVKSRDIHYAKFINKKGNVMAEVGHLADDAPAWSVFKEKLNFDNDILGELTIALDNSHIIKQIKQQRNSIIVREIILILLIAIGEFIALSLLIIKPVVNITSALNENIDNEGRIINDISYQSNDEFGQLANQFNNMRSELNRLTSKLHSKVNHANIEVQQQNKKLIEQSAEILAVNSKLENLTITDPLTELYNRRHFDSLIESEFSYTERQNENLSVIIIDLDKFKHINDTYGHESGDRVLRTIAKLFKESIRKSDTACRIGGEEFAIVCRQTDAENSKIVAEKLRLKVESTKIQLIDAIINVTACFGIMTVPTSKVKTSHDLYSLADKAMYYSKQHGRNRTTHFNNIIDKIEL